MNNQIKKAAPSGIDDGEVVKLLSLLVSVPSVNSAFRQPGDPDHWFNEAKLGAVVADRLHGIGIEVEVDFVAPQRPNVIARIKGTLGAPTMIWEGHLDTVQVTGWKHPSHRASPMAGSMGAAPSTTGLSCRLHAGDE
jgi:succinyl-diaminopimelate desuccinylase